MTTIFMVFTCAFHGAPYNFQERDGHNCYPARWINHGAPYKFSRSRSINTLPTLVALVSGAGLPLSLSDGDSRSSRLRRGGPTQGEFPGRPSVGPGPSHQRNPSA
jgi:hypothetical protein